MADLRGKDSVHPETLAEWRAWLSANHARPDGVWLISWRAATGRPRIAYEDAVEEALCFGWVDSTGGTLDAERAIQWFSPRRKGSVWARSNKERVERLEREGRMTDAGRRVIERARADGSWTLLESVEDMIVPDDLAAAFTAHPGSREQWESFPPSARRIHLGWIVQAKTPGTRARRIAEIAEKASRGERAGQQSRD